MKFTRSVTVVASLALTAGAVLLPATSASAASSWKTIGPYRSQGSCTYERNNYGQVVPVTHCWQLTYGGEPGWYFDAYLPR